ncbi:hypothetical protein ACFFU1_11860 [Algibacter miyuki]|uniref:DUF1735 domain-containing protein n=1 Tax=Algibacter miyuki TaxID=1306933 RepID=A0ABV5H132_9FLAO|nr:hypothetical protein [Algibacter miyuki]MDN3666215.1 hypothetical protein [Algibacter miyuki]
MKNFKLLTILALSIILFNSCDYDDQDSIDIDYVGFVSDFTIGVAPTGTIDEEISIYATKTTSSERTLTLSIDSDLTTADATAYTVPNSITIPAGSTKGTFTLNAIGENISTSGLDLLVLSITSNDGTLVGEPLSINLQQVCPYPETELSLTFDDYASEISWELTDSDDNILFSGGPYTDGDTDISSTFCLGNGDYTFILKDSYGDGFAAPGAAIIYNNGVELVNISGDFGNLISQAFTISN